MVTTDTLPLAAEDASPKDPPSLAAIVASAIPRTDLPLRARVLRRLLMPVGPLALTVLAGGVFAKYAASARWSRITVSLEDAARVTSSQIADLVRYVEQSNPTVLEQVIVVMSRDATVMAAVGASVAALVLQLRANRNIARKSPPGGA
jgi:predicted regulator of Ras-like GTPase activity (Roadblock/LC7/MglB family)